MISPTESVCVLFDFCIQAFFTSFAEACGNGIREGNETCDDNNTVSYGEDTCSMYFAGNGQQIGLHDECENSFLTTRQRFSSQCTHMHTCACPPALTMAFHSSQMAAHIALWIKGTRVPE